MAQAGEQIDVERIVHERERVCVCLVCERHRAGGLKMVAFFRTAVCSERGVVFFFFFCRISCAGRLLS